MPTSANYFDQKVTESIRGYKTFLDIGAGEGKYEKIIRSVSKGAKITAVEPYKPYHKHLKGYDKIISKPAHEMIGDKGNYDVVIMGDVIEHMKKSDAIDFLNYIIYKCKKIIIVYPVAYIQESKIPWENHISIWSEYDFYSFRETTETYNDRVKITIIDGLLEDR